MTPFDDEIQSEYGRIQGQINNLNKTLNQPTNEAKVLWELIAANTAEDQFRTSWLSLTPHGVRMTFYSNVETPRDLLPLFEALIDHGCEEVDTRIDKDEQQVTYEFKLGSVGVTFYLFVGDSCIFQRVGEEETQVWETKMVPRYRVVC